MIKNLVSFSKKLSKSFAYKLFYASTFVRYRYNPLPHKKYLELGSGPRKGKEHWLTLDTNIYCDMPWDLRYGIPLPNNSVERIYSSHLFEHIPYKGQQFVMAECLRVLKSGCEFSICVPNARLYIEAYLRGENFRKQNSYWKPAFPDNNTLMDQINYIAYMGGEHNYMFDRDNMLSMLTKAGLVQCSERQFDPTIDSINRDFESLYFKAFKDKGNVHSA